jgi:sigma-54 dependent transcriptional regulator
MLRVLQEREIYRLGSRTPIPIDVRVIAATNVHLDEAVAAGNFREDLLYRLRVVSLDLHPLRERPGDILPIATYFVADYCQRLGFENPVEISPASRLILLAHPWPGNIRELENVVHHALLVCKNNCIEPENLHLSLQHSALANAVSSRFGDSANSLESSLIALFENAQPKLFEQIENIVFRTAYHYCQDNQLQTARLLDISRNVVRARLLRSGELSAPREAPVKLATSPLFNYDWAAKSSPVEEKHIQLWSDPSRFSGIRPLGNNFRDHSPSIPASAHSAVPSPVDRANLSVLMLDWPGQQ